MGSFPWTWELLLLQDVTSRFPCCFAIPKKREIESQPVKLRKMSKVIDVIDFSSPRVLAMSAGTYVKVNVKCCFETKSPIWLCCWVYMVQRWWNFPVKKMCNHINSHGANQAQSRASLKGITAYLWKSALVSSSSWSLIGMLCFVPIITIRRSHNDTQLLTVGSHWH